MQVVGTGVVNDFLDECWHVNKPEEDGVEIPQMIKV